MHTNIGKQKKTGNTSQSEVKPTTQGITSEEELQVLSIHERLKKIDPDVVEQELKELVRQIEATNERLEKSKAVTHETLKLVVSL